MKSNFWDLKNKEKLCIFDIDGVLLSQYPQCWINFVNKKLNKKYDDLHKMKRSISYETYRELKEEYRTCGIKTTFKPEKSAAKTLLELKKRGFTIIIMTARPANIYPTLYNQTLSWLKKNKLVFDFVYFEEKNKHAKILAELPHTKFIVEDNSFNANQIEKWGYRVFLLNNKYNEKIEVGKYVIRIEKLNDILKWEH